MKIKQKVRKGVVKRFKVTKNGKVLHRGHGLRHHISAKSKSNMRSLKKVKKITGIFARKIKKMLAR